ncbi:CGNR zinc finger domain-containing protein [Plantactinospora sp. GCM10030261]|uniref:CGNR zinc finger domain-containing protein n=1 Tax=Plantactinospora sp. GCM10030261 TaxID=3273420 RepID=UPI00360C1F2B
MDQPAGQTRPGDLRRGAARLKSCAAHPCRWAYYDHSPAGRSRWCTMSICGSRAKMRAFRAARK